MGNLEKKLLNELKRFNQIGYNSQNLGEQNLGGFGNLGMGSHVERILGKTELGEQEDVETDVETDAEEDVTSFDELGLDDAEVEMETGSTPAAEDIPTTPPTPSEIPTTPPTTPTTPPPAIPGAPEKEDENTTEVEVTDLVSNQETLEKNTSETNDKLESLMSMLDGMEEKLSGMDQLMNQISSLEQKIEKYRPKSEEEKLDLRKQDSGPFDQSLSDFWDDNQDKYKEQGKEEYILTPQDVENYSETDIQKSFNV
tara:strand:- start:248 stop:1012 length:765 start_codon:yes stop_codon:yes gene_type:complete